MRDHKVSWRIRHVLTDETPQSAGVAQLLLQLGCESFLDNGKSGLDQSQMMVHSQQKVQHIGCSANASSTDLTKFKDRLCRLLTTLRL